MQTTGVRSSIRLGTNLTIMLGFIFFGLNVPVSWTNRTTSTLATTYKAAQDDFKPSNPSATDVDLLAGIGLSQLVTHDDRAYLKDNLEFLHDRLPQWWQHIVAAEPFALSVDERLGAQGRAATTRCCEVGAMITFGFHFEQLTVSDDPASQTTEARRVRFLAVLIHEATHVRDLRTGRFGMHRDFKTCVEAERSGLTKQLEFEQDLARIQIDADPVSNAIYAARLGKVIAAESAALRSRETWNQYCAQWLGD